MRPCCPCVRSGLQRAPYDERPGWPAPAQSRRNLVDARGPKGDVSRLGVRSPPPNPAAECASISDGPTRSTITEAGPNAPWSIGPERNTIDARTFSVDDRSAHASRARTLLTEWAITRDRKLGAGRRPHASTRTGEAELRTAPWAKGAPCRTSRARRAQWPPDPANDCRRTRAPWSGSLPARAGSTWKKDPAHELSLRTTGSRRFDLSSATPTSVGPGAAG